MHTTIVRDPRFAPETDALLELMGKPAPLDYPTVLAGRDQPADPTYAGKPDPAVHLGELYLPLRWGPCRARLYAAPAQRPKPLLLWLHGGGFVGGSGRDLDAPCARMARNGRVTVVSLEYRLAPEHPYPAAVEDAYDALSWLHEHGTTIGGDGRVVVGGQSAGGNLAAAVSLLARDQGHPAVSAQALCYPVLDFGQRTESTRLFDGVLLSIRPGRWEEHAYLAGQTAGPYAAPLRAGSLTGLPPALVIGAGRDPLRDDARTYAARLDAAAVPVQHLEYADTMHAFMNFAGVLTAGMHAADAIAMFVRDTVRNVEVVTSGRTA